jgi:hypothetical protein
MCYDEPEHLSGYRWLRFCAKMPLSPLARMNAPQARNSRFFVAPTGVVAGFATAASLAPACPRFIRQDTPAGVGYDNWMFPLI